MTGVRARLEGITQVNEGLEQINQFARDFHQVAGDLWLETYNEIRPPFLNELQTYAPPKRGSRYVRTMRLKRGWIIRLVRLPDGYQMVVENTTPYTKWVVGSFDQRRDYQTQMHKETGWFPARQTKDFWFAAFDADFRKRFDRYLSGYGVFKVSKRNR